MSALPPGWAEAELATLCEINPRHSSDLDRTRPVSFVPMPYVDEVDGVIRRKDSRALGDVWSGYTHFRDGDILFAKITPCMENGKIAIARDLEGGLGCGSTEFHVLRALGGVEPNFVWHILRQADYRRTAETVMTGAVGQRRVPASYICQTCIALPPLAEQRRIVAKIDALTARSKRARAELEQVRVLRNRLLAAILDGPESERWPSSSISEVADVVTGSTPPTGRNDCYGGDVPFVKPTDLEAGYSVINARQTLSAKGVSCSRPVPSGSTLLTCIGATIGKTGFARTRVCTNQQINALVPNLERVYPEWLYWAIISPKFRSLVIENASATTMPIINKGRLQRLAISVPSFPEQRAIVARIETAFAALHRVEAEAKAAERALDRLDQAILAKAFRGELVPQDPADQPASALLARIAAERAATPKPARGRRRSAAP